MSEPFAAMRGQRRPGWPPPVPVNAVDAAVSTSHVETAGHRRVVLRHLVDGVLPLKFAYTGSAAFAHDAYARSEDYLVGLASAQRLSGMLRGLAPGPGSFHHVVEIGPGNGVRTAAVLQSLAAHGQPCRRYLGLDFSGTLLGLACGRIREALGDRMRIDAGLWDIEGGSSARIHQWRRGGGPLVVWLFGQTLGNVESERDTLRHVWESLCTGDVLLANVFLGTRRSTHRTVLDPYHSATFRAAILEPLRSVGIDLAHVDLTMGNVAGVVTGEVVFRRAARLGRVTVPAGHRLRCFKSRRFEQVDVLSALAATGWSVEHAVADETGSQLLVKASREGRCGYGA